MKPFVVLALVAMLIAGSRSALAAQEGTPIAPYATDCVVQPMPQETIDALAAEAATITPAESPRTETSDFPDGNPVSLADQERILVVIGQMDACSEAQDLPRWLSLFSDQYIVDYIFAEEPVQIVPVTPSAEAEASTTPMATDQGRMLLDAVLLDDGRIVALVSRNAWGGHPQVIWFAEQDGTLKIDAIAEYRGGSAAGGATGLEIPMDAQPAVDLVVQDAAVQLAVDPSELTITAIEAVDWPDSSLGCPEDDGVYAPVVSSGYRITVSNGAQSLEYHTGPNDVVVNCET
ncbi:MAG: hypothetical protein KC438_03885 [Thermomicrobiales bacterium]|nr:hypothetical protein [Thermomicrobiales bacterium]MCO5222087.1 hypothetical protein [Thermomicrobiales bacterium]